jgi:hypothetical protein
VGSVFAIAFAAFCLRALAFGREYLIAECWSLSTVVCFPRQHC